MMSSLKTFPSNISSKETEVLNDVHLSTLQPRNPETGPQSHHPGKHLLIAILPLGSLRLKSQISAW
jgi:hypothetical protein